MYLFCHVSRIKFSTISDFVAVIQLIRVRWIVPICAKHGPSFLRLMGGLTIDGYGAAWMGVE